MMHTVSQQARYAKRLDEGHRKTISEAFVAPGGESSRSSSAPVPLGPTKAEFNRLVKERFIHAEETRREEEAANARRRNEKAQRMATMEAINAEAKADQERHYRETIQGYKRVAEREQATSLSRGNGPHP